uniref:transposase n=1 Tax=Defluviicoccus vanus TaxID=111831 RepID=UPI001CBA665E|nr:transposase [Defluviicoccus vanus]
MTVGHSGGSADFRPWRGHRNGRPSCVFARHGWRADWTRRCRVRGRIETIFGTRKRSYGLRRMRWRGLTKEAAQVRFTESAYNLKRALTILAAAA